MSKALTKTRRIKKTEQYIFPSIKPLEKKDLEAERKQHSQWSLYFDKKHFLNSIDELFNKHKNFVIAEPGYGKTRLLKEILASASKKKMAVAFVDLKHVSDVSIADFVQQKFGFSLKEPRQKFVLCIDALDEVKAEKLADITQQIIEINSSLKGSYLFVSCRIHFFEKYADIFSETDFTYLKILPFLVEQIESYLVDSGLDKASVEKLLDSISFQDRPLVIQVPRYLEYLVAYISKNGLEAAKGVTRVQLFDFFINEALSIKGRETMHLKFDFLTKLALIMEINQNNVIIKSEFSVFLDKLDSDMKFILLNAVGIDELNNHSLLKDNGNAFEFDNTEFQEFLAAKAILNFNDPKQAAAQFVFDSVLREVIPSWFNTLTFLIDLDISFLPHILSNVDFAGLRTSIVDETYFNLITRVEVDRLSASERSSIFCDIFDYYARSLQWIDWGVASNLSYYFISNDEKVLKRLAERKKWHSESERYISLGNLALIVGAILKNNKESLDIPYWRKKLIEFTEDTNTNGVLQRHGLVALIYLDDVSVIPEIEEVAESPDEHIRSGFLRLCRKIAPNAEISFNHFMEGTRNRVIEARQGLYEITEAGALKRVLTELTDKDALGDFLDHSSVFEERDQTLVKNIENVFDVEIGKLITKIIEQSMELYRYRQSEFIQELVKLMDRKTTGFLHKFLDIIRNKQGYPEMYFRDQSELISDLIKRGKAKEFIDDAFTITKAYEPIVSIFFKAKANSRNDIYADGRKHLKKEYDLYKAQHKKARISQRTSNKETYNKFHFMLKPAPKTYNPDVFNFYLDHRKEIDTHITQRDRKRLIYLVNLILGSSINPAKEQIKITHESGDSMSYSANSWVWVFGECIKLARVLGMDVKKHRAKIVGYIPFAYHEHLDAIFDLIGALSQADIQHLMTVYKKNKKSDLWRFMPTNFVETVQKYKVISAIPLLKRFIDEKKFKFHTRLRSLEVLGELTGAQKDIQRVFAKYKSSTDENEKELADCAMRTLAEKFNDSAAIEWIFSEIKRRVFPFERRGAASSYIGNETHEKKFARPLLQMTDQRWMKNYFDLLEKSFKTWAKGELYYEYTQYMWNIVLTYFKNLRLHRSYKPLQELEKQMQKYQGIEGANWFLGKLAELKKEYVQFMGKPSSVAASVQIYNIARAKEDKAINDAWDLFETIKQVIDVDLRNWVEAEGAYKFMTLKLPPKRKGKSQPTQNELLIQQTIKAELGFALAKKGLADCDIIREPQLLDGKKVDFLISYGLIGSVLIEIKLSTNSDLTPKFEKRKSYAKLKQYMRGYPQVKYGIFLVFDLELRDSKNREKYQSEITDAYKKISDNLQCMFLSCAGNESGI